MELARRARPLFEAVEMRDDPTEALVRAHELGEPVLVTGSLYLLADLETAGASRRRLACAGGLEVGEEVERPGYEHRLS